MVGYWFMPCNLESNPVTSSDYEEILNYHYIVGQSGYMLLSVSAFLVRFNASRYRLLRISEDPFIGWVPKFVRFVADKLPIVPKG